MCAMPALNRHCLLIATQQPVEPRASALHCFVQA